MSQQPKPHSQEKHPFIEWVDEVEQELGWTDNKWTTNAKISASVLNNARNKGVIPKWEACLALANAANKSPVTAFRKAGLLPPGPEGDISMEDWKYLLEQMSETNREKMRRFAEKLVDVDKEEKSLKQLSERKAGG